MKDQNRLLRCIFQKQPSALSVAAALFLLSPVAAWGGALCPGKYHYTAVGNWPSNVTLNVPLDTVGSAGATRASAFRSGLQQSGIRIDSNSPITLKLIVSVASFGNAKGAYSGIDWIDTAFSTSLRDTALPGSSLSITVVVSDDDKYQDIWVATMECTIQTDNSEALARDIGVDLGQLLSDAVRTSH